jgi:hypothetical protein
LERIYTKAARHDTKIFMGDFNAKLGKELGLTPKVDKISLKGGALPSVDIYEAVVRTHILST